MSTLPVQLAHELPPATARPRWLVEGLWAESAVGIVGGEPKCCKSFLALDVAVAVASGAACLRQFAVAHPGPVLLYAAEDALHVVRERLQGIAEIAGTDLRRLPIHVITAASLRLDVERDRAALHDTVAAIRPRLLVLDPFVRLHRIDENLAGDVAPLLAHLRALQRHFDTSVLLVHHARKSSHVRAGQALRGSSELHAWGDSNLYLRRDRDKLWLSIEHRAAASVPALALTLCTHGTSVALHVADDVSNNTARAPERTTVERPNVERTPADRVIAALASAVAPLSRRALRDACRMRSAALGPVLAALLADGRVARHERGYLLANTPAVSR
jgi:hypothetical protein